MLQTFSIVINCVGFLVLQYWIFLHFKGENTSKSRPQSWLVVINLLLLFFDFFDFRKISGHRGLLFWSDDFRKVWGSVYRTVFISCWLLMSIIFWNVIIILYSFLKNTLSDKKHIILTPYLCNKQIFDSLQFPLNKI